MRSAFGTLGIALAASIATAGVFLFAQRREPPPPAHAKIADPTPPPPIEATRITGKLPLENMPAEIGAALEQHSDEIVKTAEALEAKQERITGVCAPGSAIRLIGPDGSVTCQRFPRGVASVTALAAVPRFATTVTAPGNVRGGVGRYQTSGDDDYLIVPVALPDGAIVTSFAYVFYDASELDGSAYLYRSDDKPMAMVKTEGAVEEVRLLTTDHVEQPRVDAHRYAYFVYFQTSAQAQDRLMPISASVHYRLP